MTIEQTIADIKERVAPLQSPTGIYGLSSRTLEAALTTAYYAGQQQGIRDVRERLLLAVPKWWEGTADEYTRCVEMNFAEAR